MTDYKIFLNRLDNFSIFKAALKSFFIIFIKKNNLKFFFLIFNFFFPILVPGSKPKF